MLSKKRRNVSSSSNSDANPFLVKKVAPESPFSGQAFSGQAFKSTDLKLGAAAPSLDRRKAIRQRVRALNTEFASWVKNQLQDHPDELWEDGVRDYITHTSDILEKFSDVVNWLKTNSHSDGSVSTVETQNIEKNNGSDTVIKENPAPVESIFGISSNNVGLSSSSTPGVSTTSNSIHSTTAGSTPSWSFGLSTNSQAATQNSSGSFTTSWNPDTFLKTVSPVKEDTPSSSPNSGISFFSQTTSPSPASSSGLFSTSSTSLGLLSTSLTPSVSSTPSFTTPWSAGAFSSIFGGNQVSAPSTIATEVADEDDEPQQPSSPSLKKSEEDGIVIVHETKCKLFVKSTDSADKEPWKDKGIGQLFIKSEEGASKGTKESRPRILVRNDVGRIMLNASLYTGIKTNLQKKSIVAIFHTLDESAGDGGSSKPIARTFLIRVKNEDERNKLATVIQEHAPTA